MRIITRLLFATLMTMFATVSFAQEHDYELDGIYYGYRTFDKGYYFSDYVEYTENDLDFFKATYKDDFCYEGLFVVGYDKNHEFRDVVIPPVIDGKPVLGIYIHAFNECTTINSIDISEGIVVIDRQAFMNSNIVSITIPASTTHIKGGAFTGCRYLKKIKVSEDNPSYSAEGAALFNKSKTALISCPSCQTHYNIPTGITYMSFETFYGCHFLNSVIVPEGVTEIGFRTFRNCYSMTHVTIPSTVSYIAKETFSNNSKLKYFICKADYPPRIGYDCFVEIPSDAILYVPNESIRTYKDSEWGAIFSEVQPIPDMEIPTDIADGTDLTYVIMNPNFDDNRRDNWVVDYSFGNGRWTNVAAECAEMWSTDFNVYQDITGLPTGLYRIGVQGFVRNGKSQEAFENYLNGTEEIPGFLYGTTGLSSASPSTNKVPFTSVFAGKDSQPHYATTVDGGTGPADISITDNNGNTFYVPNGMTGFSEWEKLGDKRFDNSVDVYVQDGTLRIGVICEEHKDNDFWCIFDSFTLTYINNANNQEPLNILLAAGENLTNEKDMQLKTFAMEVNDADSLYSTLYNSGSMTADSVWVSDILPANKWTFIALPFNVKVYSISHDNPDIQFAIHCYDGAGRAAHGIGDNWKRIQGGEMLMAGKGFIIQHNAAGGTDNSKGKSGRERFVFPASDNIGAIFVSGDVTMPLAEHPSTYRCNAGWNLIGNPYPCYYDMSHSDFTAPVTIWNGEGYDAYRPQDDEVVLHPFEAFFVQRQERDAITFKAQAPSPVPPRGEAVTNDSGKRSVTAKYSPSLSNPRTIINLTVHALPHGEGRGGGCRIVLNEEASRDYELHCDAAKFFGNGIDLYTVEGGTAYAINERPLDDGAATIGFSCKEAGTYTISSDVPLCYEGMSEAVTSYTFHAKAGKTLLKVSLNDATGIAAPHASTDGATYTLSGVRVDKPQHRGIYIRGGRKYIR